MPDRPSARLDRSDHPRTRSGLRTAVVWDVLRPALAAHVSATGRGSLDVLDTGGGTGGFAVPLAQEGHRVTVVDPSPDSLAALDRRAAEAGVTDRVTGVQGEAAGLLDVVAPDSADLALCHSVLEFVDEPAAALAAVVRATRSGGLVSVLAANPHAVVLARAASGQFAAARHVLGDPDGRWGDADPTPRRFTLEQVSDLLAAAGLAIRAVHGVRVFVDLVPGELVESEPGAYDALRALEADVAERPAFRDVATQLHLLAERG
ncbi:MAG: methyltransferase domain-containing protein [Actinomycetes bacterium]